MKKTKRDEKALVRIVGRLAKSWRQEAKQAAGELYDLLDEEKNVDTAVRELSKTHPALFKLTGLKEALVEAAAYGYGIVPGVLTTAEAKAWGKNLSESWDESGMTLSEKLHGTDVKMREAIIDTVRTQMKKNAAWTAAARELYDGYNSGKAVTLQQAMPQYLEAVRRASGGGAGYLRAARTALRNINRLSQKGAPTKALKAAYRELVEAAASGSEKELEKACRTAIEEKSRYVADRIIRTEAARAYADGFWADALADDDVVAVKWKLSSRHPVFDLCDMYAKADMYGLGAGIFPKDKVPPLPVHPHCLCRVVEVYKGEINPGRQKEQIREAGDKWLKGLAKTQRERVLTIAGEKAWQKGGDWREYARGWMFLASFDSRLTGVIAKYTIKATGTWSGHKSLPKDGAPNSVVDHINDDGTIKARAFYDSNGRKYKELHFGTHGNPKTHPYGEHGEHAHDYEWNEDGSLKSKNVREITGIERTENDIP